MNMNISLIFEAIDLASVEMSNMSKAIENLGKAEAAAASQQIQHHRDKRHALAAEAVEVAGLAYSLYNVTDAAVQYERSMTGVKKVTQFHNEKQAIQDLGDEILALSKEIPISAEGIATLIEGAGQAGVVDGNLSDGAQIDAYMSYATTAAQIGTAFDISAQQAGDTATLWSETWGLAKDEVLDLADATNHLSNNMNASAPDILNILQRHGGFVRATTGLADAQVAALSASFAAAAPNAEIASTSMKNMISALTEGANAPKSQLEAFEALGFSASEMATRMQTDAAPAIIEVFEAIQNAPDELRSGLLTKAFGQESIGAIATLSSNTDALRESFELVADPADRAGSFIAEYEAQSQTSYAEQQRFMNGMKALKIVVGEALLPVLSDLIIAVTPLIQSFSDWASANPETISMLAKIAVSLLAVKAATIPLRYSYHTLMGTFGAGRLILGRSIQLVGTLGRIMSVSGGLIFKGAGVAARGLRFIMLGVRALSIAMMANPVGLVIAAVAAIAGAAYLIYKNWDAVKAYFVELWNAVTSIFTGAWDVVAGIFTGDGERVVSGLSKIWDGISKILLAPFEIAWGAITAIFAEFGIQFNWNPLDIIKAAWSGIGDFIGNMFGGIGETISKTWDKVSGFFNWWGGKDDAIAQAEAIAELPKKLDATNPQAMISAAEASNQLAKNIDSIQSANLNKLSTDANALASDIVNVKGAVLQSIDEMDAALAAIDFSYHGSRLMETLAAGVRSGTGFLTSAMSAALAETRAYLPSSPAKTGPLSDIHKLKFMETIASSINSAPLLSAVNNAMGTARKAMTPLGQGFGQMKFAHATSGHISPSSSNGAPREIVINAEFHNHGPANETMFDAAYDKLVAKIKRELAKDDKLTVRRSHKKGTR